MNNIPKFKQKLETIDNWNGFDDLAIEAFNIQFVENKVYRSFVNYLGIQPSDVKNIGADLVCLQAKNA